MPKKPTSRFPFYVYDLIDPRTGEVFYVGCGTGNRHRISAQNNDPAVSKHKYAKLLAIRAAGQEPISKIVYAFAEHHQALRFEWERQRRFKLPNTPADPPAPARSDYKKPVRGSVTPPKPIPIGRKPKGLPPVETWCGHPAYARVCRFLPVECKPPKPERKSTWTQDPQQGPPPPHERQAS